MIAGTAAAAALTTLGDFSRETGERARTTALTLTGDDDNAAAATSARWSVLLRTAVLTGSASPCSAPGADGESC